MRTNEFYWSGLIEIQYPPDARYKANACYSSSKHVSLVQQMRLRFVRTHFTREADVFMILYQGVSHAKQTCLLFSEHVFHTRRTRSHLYVLKFARARIRFSKRRVYTFVSNASSL